MTIPSAPRPLYPSPRFSWIGKLAADVAKVCIEQSATLPGEARAQLAAYAASQGLTTVDALDCSCEWRIRPDASPSWLGSDAAAIWNQAGANPERYAFSTTAAASGVSTSVAAGSPRAMFYALSSALLASGQPKRIVEATVVDTPSFRIRGFVEGTYGSVWTKNQRSTLLQTMGRLRMNTYVYGPKCDCYATQDRWRDGYPAGAVQDVDPGCGDCSPCQPVSGDDIREAVRIAEANGIDFIWAVSPFQRSVLRYDREGVTPVLRKIDAMRAMGVHRFAVFIDDSGGEAGRGNAQDASTHAAVLNDVHRYVESVEPGAHLLAVGAGYAFGPDSYTDTLGQNLDPEIEVMWTGPQIVSEVLTVAHFTPVNASFRRQVSLWDNWAWEEFFSGHPAGLAQVLTGTYLNPVLSECVGHPPSTGNQWRILGPAADYAWNPERFAASSAAERTSYDAWAARGEPAP